MSSELNSSLNLIDFSKITANVSLIHNYPFTFAGESSAKNVESLLDCFLQILICTNFIYVL